MGRPRPLGAAVSAQDDSAIRAMIPRRRGGEHQAVRANLLRPNERLLTAEQATAQETSIRAACKCAECGHAWTRRVNRFDLVACPVCASSAIEEDPDVFDSRLDRPMLGGSP